MAENLGLKAAGLYAEGNSFGTISEKLEVSKSSVGGLLRDGIDALRNNNVQKVAEQVNGPENKGHILPDLGDALDFDGLLTKTLLIHATPILKKVALNSKVFLQHEYFVKTLGYEGDVGDLLVEALNYYWKQMGFSIRISHDSVM